MRMTPAYLAALVLGAVASAQPLTPDLWTAHRDGVLGSAGLVRYYSFEGLAALAGPAPADIGGQADLVPGRADGEGDLVAELIEGPARGTTAVRLDLGYYSAPPVAVEDRSFSVSAWVRLNGPGAVRGSPITYGGTILSQGSGYFDGWRLTMLYPDGVLGLETGRPAPGPSFGIRTGPVADGVWHHVVASWDGRRTRIYVDGILCADGAYDGPYTAPAADAPLRVGFAGYGWGTVVLDIDEIAVYSRPLSPSEAVLAACPGSDGAAEAAQAFDQAEGRVEAGDIAGAIEALATVASRADLPSAIRAAAAIRMAELLQRERQGPQALEALASVIRLPDVPEGLFASALGPLRRIVLASGGAPMEVYEALLAHDADMPPGDGVLLRLALARQYAAAGRADEAEALRQEVLTMEGLGDQERLEVMLQAGHASAAAGEAAQARLLYERVAADAAAPAHVVSHARMLAAEALVTAGDFTAAEEALKALAEDPATPWYHHWEAKERLRQISRVAAGLSPRDPEWSRTTIAEVRRAALTLHVAPDGDDDAAGTSEAPLATLGGARDAIRRARATGLSGPVEVIVGPGVYVASSALALTRGDSGSADAPVTYRAEQPGTAILTGGARIGGFAPVTDAAILARLPEEAHGRVVCTDLTAQGITELGALVARGYSHPAAPVVELFANGVPCRPARWPNDDFVMTGEIVERTPEGAVSFRYGSERMARWASAEDPWAYGFWRWLWADEYLPIAEFDTAGGTIRMARQSGHGDTVASMPFFVLNLLEEIDEPGEWYLDRTSGMLYVYPPASMEECEFQLSMLSEPFVAMDEASHIRIEGLTFEFGRADGITISGGQGCLVAACTIRRIGGTGVTIAGGEGHGVFGCDIHTLGRGGTHVVGGDRPTLTPAGHFVENCHIHDFSRVDRTYTPSVFLDGVGNRIAHNLIHGSPGHGMRIEGNDHAIEFNEVFDVVRETDDQGGLDMWFNPTYRGNVIRYNFWHDIGNDRECGQAGIRLDDAISGVHVYGNVFTRCSEAQFGAVQIHGGKENVIENNIMIDCRGAVSFSSWGEGRWAEFVASDQVVKETTEVVDITQPPYSTRYPDLARLSEGADVNLIFRNLVLNCDQFLMRDHGKHVLMDNVLTGADPGFADASAMDYSMPQGTLLGGFRPIPFEEIGLYGHPLRAQWPVELEALRAEAVRE